VSLPKQLRDQSSAHEARSAGDEHLALCDLGEGIGVHRGLLGDPRGRGDPSRFFETPSPVSLLLSAGEPVEKIAQGLAALCRNWQAAA
jgi:hypothetical protein